MGKLKSKSLKSLVKQQQSQPAEDIIPASPVCYANASGLRQEFLIEPVAGHEQTPPPAPAAEEGDKR